MVTVKAPAFEDIPAATEFSGPPAFEDIGAFDLEGGQYEPETATDTLDLPDDPVEQERILKGILDTSAKLEIPLQDVEKYHKSLERIDKTKPIGFMEGLTQDAMFKIPFTGSVIEGLDLLSIKLASVRLNDPEFDWQGEAQREKQRFDFRQHRAGLIPPMSEAEFRAKRDAITADSVRENNIGVVNSYINTMAEREQRGLNIWGKIGSGISVLPAWMFEFAMTSGLYKSGSVAVKQLLQKHVKSKVLAKTAGWIGGSAVRTTVGMPQRVFANTMHRSLNNDEGWATSIAKGWGQAFIEVASEQAGETIVGGISWAVKGGVNKLPFGKNFLSALQKAWVKLSPDNTAAKFAKRISTKTGYNGIIGEFGEERLASLMHAVASTETFGLPEGATTTDRLLAAVKQDFEASNLIAEAAVLSVPGAIKVSVAQLGQFASDRQLVKTIESEVGVSPQIAQTAVKLKNEKGIKQADDYLSQVKTEGEVAANEALKQKAEPPAKPKAKTEVPEKSGYDMTPDEIRAIEDVEDRRVRAIEYIDDISEEWRQLEDHLMELEETDPFQKKPETQEIQRKLDDMINKFLEPAEGGIAASAEAKQPWEMTREEFQKEGPLAFPDIMLLKTGEKRSIDGVVLYEKGKVKKIGIEEKHRRTIQGALEQNKSVPREVLEEYKSEKWAKEALEKLAIEKRKAEIPKQPWDMTDKEFKEGGWTKFPGGEEQKILLPSEYKKIAKNEGEQARDLVYELNLAGVDTLDTHRTDDGVVIHIPHNQLNTAQPFIDKYGATVRTPEDERIGHYLTVAPAAQKPTRPVKAKGPKAQPEKKFYTSVPEEWRQVEELYDWGTKGLRKKGREPVRAKGQRPRKTFIWQSEFEEIPVGIPRKTLNAIKRRTDEVWPVSKKRGRYWFRAHYLVPKQAVEDVRAELGDEAFRKPLPKVRRDVQAGIFEQEVLTPLGGRQLELGLQVEPISEADTRVIIKPELVDRIAQALNEQPPPKTYKELYLSSNLAGSPELFNNASNPMLEMKVAWNEAVEGGWLVDISGGKGSAALGYPRMAATARDLGLSMEPALPKKIVSAGDIVKHFEKALGVPIHGRATRRIKHPGWYEVREAGIRSGDIHRLDTVAHEVGHHVDHYYKIRSEGKSISGRKTFKVPPGTSKELLALGKALYGTTKPPGGYKSEGIAEFVRMYLFDEDIKKAAPNFHEFFTKDYLPNNPKVAKALDEAKGMITYWRLQGAEARIESQISRSKIIGSVRDRLKRFNLWFHSMWVDEFTPLRKGMQEVGIGRELSGLSEDIPPSNDPYALAVYFSQKEGGRTRQMVLDGTIDLWGNKTGPGLKEVMAPVADQVEPFSRWIVAYRAIELWKRGINPGIQKADAEFVFAKYDNPQWRQVAKDVTAWNHRILDYLVEAGGIESTAAEHIKKTNEVYVPFMRAFLPGEKQVKAGTGKGLISTAKGVHKIKGSGREIIDPFEGMIQQTRRIVSIAHKTAIARSLAQVEATHEGLAGLIWKVPAPTRATKFHVDQVKKQLLKLGVEFPEAAAEKMDALLTVYTNSPVYLGKDNIVSVVIDGKRSFYEVSPELLRVLKGTDHFYLPRFIDIIFGKPARMIKLGATGVNAAFGLVRNPIRDAMTFAVTGKHAKWGPFSSFRGMALDLTTTELSKMLGLPENEVARQFISQGGKITGFVGMDRTSTQHLKGEMLASTVGKFAIHTARHPVDALRDLFSIPEAGPRIAEYDKALIEGEKKYGKDSPSAKVYAFNHAQDVTLNFTRHGVIGKFLNGILPFFNAGVQDPSKLHRTFRERPIEATLKAIGTLTVPALMLWWLHRDEEWWKNLPPYEKANYLHFKVPGKDEIVRLPVPFTMGHIFASIPIAMLDAYYQNDPKLFTDTFGHALEQDIPGYGFWNSGAWGPIISVAMNKDWAGRPIVPKSTEKKLSEDQYREWNTQLSKIIGQVLNISPAKLEYALNAYSGGLYRRAFVTVERIAGQDEREMTATDIPILGTLFVRDPFAPKAQIERFYERREELSRLYNSQKLPNINMAIEYKAHEMVAGLLSSQWDALQDAETTTERKRLYTVVKQALDLVDTGTVARK